MNYSWQVTTSKETTASEPKETTVHLTTGVVARVTIEFPAGCRGLVGVRISQGLFQLWPLIGPDWFVTDDFTIELTERYLISAGEDTLRIETYNTDDTYEHTITVGMTVLPIEADATAELIELVGQRLPEDIGDTLKSLPALYDVTTELKQLLQTGVMPLLERIGDIEQRQFERSVKDMSFDELSRI